MQLSWFDVDVRQTSVCSLGQPHPQALHNGSPVDRSFRQKGVFVVWQLEHTCTAAQ